MHHVAGDQLRQGDLPGFAVAHHRGGDADHGLELGRGGVGPGFLDETQDHAQNHHGHHDRGRPEVSGESGYGCQDGQQDHQGIHEGAPQEF